MTAVSQSSVLLALAVLGAIAQFAIGLRLYEPPDEYGDSESSTLEAAVFFVVFLLLYAAIGYGLAALEDVAPPLGRILVLVVGAVGVYSVYSTAFGGRGEERSAAVRAMGAVTGAVVAASSGAVLVL